MPIDVGLFHRLGIAVRGDGESSARWFAETLGTTITYSKPEPGDSHWTTMFDIGPTSIALFSANDDDTEGTIARYLDRFGAGLHSLAWRVADLEGAEASVRARGITITGINREARHWFLHPKESFGVLIELTDQGADRARVTTVGGPPAREIAWMSAVVEDIDGAHAFLADLFGARTVEGLPGGAGTDETVVDLAIGDVVLRLVQPLTRASRYAGGRGLHSMALRVDSFSDVPLPILEREGDRAWTDPEDSMGLRLEWTTIGAATRD